MAARTSAANGNWGDTGTWTGGVVPGDGDTVIISHNVTLTGNVTVGAGGATGSTAAIDFGAVTGKTLAIGSFRLICKGDIKGTASYNGTNTITGGAGGRLTFLPPSGQQYGFIGVAASGLEVNLTGSVGSLFTIDTDLTSSGLASVTDASTAFNKYIAFNLDYVQVTDCGTASAFGIDSRVIGSHNQSIKHTTFTHASCRMQGVAGNSTGAFTFEDNIASSSVNVISGVTRAFEFDFFSGMAASSIARNSLDGEVFFADFIAGVVCSGNYLAGGCGFSNTSTWSSKTNFVNNVVLASETNMSGPHTGNYFYNEASDNPHFIFGGRNSAANLVENAIFEAIGNIGVVTDSGDCVLLLNFDAAIRGCISLPTYGYSGAHRGAGKIITMSGTYTGKATLEHNTCFHGAAYSETGDNAAGDLVSFKSNLIWYDSAGEWKIGRVGTGPTDLGDPADIDYNAGWNTSATQNGYEGDWSVTPGANDVSLSADPFFDKTRCLATWAAMKGQATTAAAAKALLAANPALITEADTGLLAWVRAGFRVTAPTLENAGHDGETIGAMGYVASSTGKRMDHRFLCPR